MHPLKKIREWIIREYEKTSARQKLGVYAGHEYVLNLPKWLFCAGFLLFCIVVDLLCVVPALLLNKARRTVAGWRGDGF